MSSIFKAYPRGCKEFKDVLDSGVDESLSKAFVYGSRAVRRAAERKLRKLAKLQSAIRDESKAKK
jgi:hypothetical protein